MAINKNTFSPDTCLCKIEFSFDGDLPDNQIEASRQLVQVLNKCPAHANLTDQEAYDTIWQENQLKNSASTYIAKQAGLRNNGDVDFKFDANRKLELTINPKPLTPSEKAPILEDITIKVALGKPVDVSILTPEKKVTKSALRSAIQKNLNTKYGAGKVVLK